jgi:hypothetical protein
MLRCFTVVLCRLVVLLRRLFVVFLWHNDRLKNE